MRSSKGGALIRVSIKQEVSENTYYLHRMADNNTHTTNYKFLPVVFEAQLYQAAAGHGSVRARHRHNASL